MPYLLFLKKQQNLKLSSAANYRWHFQGKLSQSLILCKLGNFACFLVSIKINFFNKSFRNTIRVSNSFCIWVRLSADDNKMGAIHLSMNFFEFVRCGVVHSFKKYRIVKLFLSVTVVPTKSDSYVMFCLKTYKGLRINRSFVY